MSRIARLFAITIVITGVAYPAEAGVGEHCSFRLVPISRQGTVTDAKLEPIGCYATYEEALEQGSGGAMEVAPTVTPQTLVVEAQPVATSGFDVLLGTEWDASNYLQSSSSYFASVTCSSQNTWQVSWVGATWNDRFESGKGFGGCDLNKKFQHVDFGGTSKTCTPNCIDYGTLANEVSSLRWKP
jgi:hypothetical protein